MVKLILCMNEFKKFPERPINIECPAGSSRTMEFNEPVLIEKIIVSVSSGSLPGVPDACIIQFDGGLNQISANIVSNYIYLNYDGGTLGLLQQLDINQIVTSVEVSSNIGVVSVTLIYKRKIS